MVTHCSFTVIAKEVAKEDVVYRRKENYMIVVLDVKQRITWRDLYS